MKILFYLTLFLLLFTHCKKEIEIFKPIIKVEKPLENQFFAANDTVFVKAVISHNKNIKDISIGIVNEQLVSVSPRYNRLVDSNQYELNSFLIINNYLELPSGKYYFYIKASDGQNESTLFVPIYLYEVPRTLEKIFVITKSPAQYTRLFELTSGFELSHLFDVSTDFGFAAYEPIEQLIYITGLYDNAIFCYDYINNQKKWSQIVLSAPSTQSFTDVTVFKKKVYAALRNQSVVAYNSEGTLVLNLPVEADLYPQNMVINDGFLITIQKSLSLQNTYLVMYYLESGAFVQKVLINLFSVKMYARDDNNAIYVFANDFFGNASLEIYDISNNGIWSPYNLPQGKLLAVEKINSTTFLLAYDNTIYKYTYNPNSLTIFVNGINVAAMKYDDINQLLWVGTKNKEVRTYSYPFATLENQIPIQDSIKDIMLIYNK